MSIQAVSWVLDHSEAKGGERLVLIAIANHYDWNDPALVALAREARLSRSAVIRAIHRLEADGELVVERDETPGRSRKNRYIITGYEESRNATIPVSEHGERVASTPGKGRAHATRTVSNRRDTPSGQPAPDGTGPDPRVAPLVAGYVDDYRVTHEGHDPPARWKGAAGRSIREALRDGESEDAIARCLGVCASENKIPTALTHVLADLHAGRARR